jgi:hypothetical protein
MHRRLRSSRLRFSCSIEENQLSPVVSVTLALSLDTSCNTRHRGVESRYLRRIHKVKKSTSVAVLALVCSLALSIMVYAQAGGDVAQQIKQLQQESRNAQMKNDVSWAQQHLADGFMAGNSWGDWETRDDFIKDLQNKTNKWKSGDISDVHVATFGSNLAVSHYTFTYEAEIKGTQRARTVICSDTWVNDSGTWKTASTHCSMVKGK